ncbi:hypothetical protein HK102_006352, partial [Quaeritorhiza haematococci]
VNKPNLNQTCVRMHLPAPSQKTITPNSSNSTKNSPNTPSLGPSVHRSIQFGIKHRIYYDVIERPMDLYTISCKLGSCLAECVYAQEADLDGGGDRDGGAGRAVEGRPGDGIAGYFADVSLMFENCFTYNGKMNLIYVYGKQLEQFFVRVCREMGLDAYVEDWKMEGGDRDQSLERGKREHDYGEQVGDGEEEEEDGKHEGVSDFDNARDGSSADEEDIDGPGNVEYIEATDFGTPIHSFPSSSSSVHRGRLHFSRPPTANRTGSDVTKGSKSKAKAADHLSKKRKVHHEDAAQGETGASSRSSTMGSQKSSKSKSSDKTASHKEKAHDTTRPDTMTVTTLTPSLSTADSSVLSAVRPKPVDPSTILEMEESSQSNDVDARQKGKGKKAPDTTRPHPSTSADLPSVASSSALPASKSKSSDASSLPLPPPPSSQSSSIAAKATPGTLSAANDIDTHAASFETIQVEWIGPPVLGGYRRNR